MQNSSKLVKIGITAIFALILLVVGINYLKGINLFDKSNRYYVIYSDVTGLTVSSPVIADGLKVGQVTDLSYMYENPGNIKVGLLLDAELKLPEGTVAKLGSDLLGTASITLQMPENTNYIPSGSMLEAGVSAGLMDNLSNDVLPGIVQMIPKIDSVLVAVTTLVTDPALTASLKRLDDITANINVMSQNIANATKPLPEVVNKASQVTDKLNSLSANLDSLSRELNNMPLNETVANVKNITDNLVNVTNQLNQDDSSLGMLINDPKLYNSLNNTVASLDSLINDIKAQPQRYLKFSVF